jgi:co-chaperonin GroES (HSP10)
MFCPYKWNMVEQVSAETKTESGIIIPDKVAAKNRQARGKVIVAGKENKFVQFGDEVLFSKENCFTDIVESADGEKLEFVFLKEDDICVVSNREHPDL